MNGELKLENYVFRDPFQGKIYELLETLVGKGTAGYYRDACRLVNSNSTFETTTNLVFHLLREIESALRDVLDEIVEEKPEDRICKECKRPFNLKHKEQIKRILRVLEPSNSSNLPNDWLV